MEKDPEHMIQKQMNDGHSLKQKGKLKIIIGAAPGSGKTYQLLKEAQDLKKSGIDVIIGFVEFHHRKETAELVADLEIVPKKKVIYQDRTFQEMDSDGIIARAPQVAIIDELAHTNIIGSHFPKRYMDIQFILEHGIDVITTVNIQHLESTYQEAEKITGTKVREIVPQSFIDQADEMEVVDVPPETLRQRLRDGDIFARSSVNHALEHFFKKQNLLALRELTLRAVGDTVDNRFQKSFERMSILGPVGAKEVILVCTSFLARSALLIRKGYRMVKRLNADLIILTILEMPEAELSKKEDERMSKLRSLAAFCHAEFMSEVRNDRPIGKVILDVAGQLEVTQIVIGQMHASGGWNFWRPNPVNYLLLHMNYADLHIVGWQDRGRPYLITDGAKSQRFSERNKGQGRLTIYIGLAPGVGKTYRMLQDANEWLAKGTDVVAGIIETHGRKETADQIGRLVLLPPQFIYYNDRQYEELNVAGTIRRHPEIVLIDELAHTNVPGSKRKKRYEDVLYILMHGIDVVTTVNIQHLESLRDTVEHITGVKVKERVPDWLLDEADRIKLIDITPEALQVRLTQGKVYVKDKIEHAMNHFFRLGNLSVLRELSLFKVADNADRNREPMYRNSQKPRVLVCVNNRSHSEKLIRRGWRLADRYHADLYVLTVVSDKVKQISEEKDVRAMKQLSEQMQAIFLKKEAPESRVGEIITKTAEELRVQQIVVGQPFPVRNFFDRFKHHPIIYVLLHAEFVNLHVVANSRGHSNQKTQEF